MMRMLMRPYCRNNILAAIRTVKSSSCSIRFLRFERKKIKIVETH